MSEETTWLDGIEDEALRIDPTVVRFKNLDDVAKSLIEAKAYNGRSIAFPGDEATEEQWAAWDAKMTEKVPGLIRKDNPDLWTTLGVPGEADGYTLPDDFEGLDDVTIQQVRDVALAAGYTNKQFQDTLAGYATMATEVGEANRIAQEERVTALKKAWGAAYDDNIRITDTIASKFNGDKPVENMSNEERLRWIGVANAIKSDPQVFNQINNPSPRKTPAELMQDIDDMRLKLRDKSVTGPARKSLLKRYEAMYEELDKYS